jgi:thioredoxin reductase (NADPH)
MTSNAMMVLTTRDRDREAILQAFADPARLVVVSLCAAWCDTCTQFRGAFERLAQARPHAAFVWLDIEDDAAIAGDVDVENFPTLAIYRGRSPLHFGVSLPHETTVGRLVDALAEGAPARTDMPDEVAELPSRFTPV